MTCPSLLRRGHAADLVGDVSRATAQWARTSAPGLTDRLRGERTAAQFARFVLVGAVTTVVYAVLFVALRPWGYLPAHLVATAVSTVLANELHRRLTFRAEERVHWFTAQWEAGGVTVLGLLATSSALGWLDAVTGGTHPGLQIATVVAVTALIGLIRFIALRWIFRPAPAAA
ncbi:GtrA family protein [Blastococcus xanthinilyticus]|uniref:Putative flippase GtrA n=1 Tax=Blastococcus xanthinilyticus TaxID=1564164 RepID=A0A5S5CVQ9_9ACTN|nr:GtrA family protein [Blastococcus xanthinilyticus]TYP87867.1 putative flippase GtrA [Blastococcus xanthinilyticus]